MTNDARLKQLRSKETLTNDEMNELVRLSPEGMLSLPNMETLGVTDFGMAFQNLKEGAERTRNAFDNGCYLEVISLRLQHIEFWLRIFWVAKNGKRKIFEADDKRTFGTITNNCSDLGFNTDLISKLNSFNSYRINAIHKVYSGSNRLRRTQKRLRS
jgi:hypothetical protein